MSAEDAKEQLVEALKAEAKTEAMSLIQDMVEEAKLLQITKQKSLFKPYKELQQSIL